MGLVGVSVTQGHTSTSWRASKYKAGTASGMGLVGASVHGVYGTRCPNDRGRLGEAHGPAARLGRLVYTGCSHMSTGRFSFGLARGLLWFCLCASFTPAAPTSRSCVPWSCLRLGAHACLGWDGGGRGFRENFTEDDRVAQEDQASRLLSPLSTTPLPLVLLSPLLLPPHPHLASSRDHPVFSSIEGSNGCGIPSHRVSSHCTHSHCIRLHSFAAPRHIREVHTSRTRPVAKP